MFIKFITRHYVILRNFFAQAFVLISELLSIIHTRNGQNVIGDGALPIWLVQIPLSTLVCLDGFE